LLDGDADVSQYRIVAKDGETRWMLDYARPVWDEAEDRVVRVYGAAQDITERMRAEELLLQFNRALMVLSRCNEVLVRATDELALLREVCHLLVETGGYRLAWVGFARQDAQKSIHPVAYAGLEEGYLETSNFTWADTAHGREPTGTAIRTCAPAVCRNILTDPAFAPWHNDAVRRGYASALALPLTAGDEVLGVLTIYASRPDAFDVEEVRLLTELADNLAYGVVSLRSRTRGGAEARA
jgi:GAF domain-containing protein